uniref:Telomeric repeat-binding factor 2-interacting protein 1 n=1 Tax=Neogobius melanostomus TaxID=47308 RepID=A0A8C6UET2_9GOBI
MSFKQDDEVKISPTLFETEHGEPLCFYLRPGPVKRELMPIIKAAGGLLCNFQKPGAILLKDPDEKASITQSTAHWYVSTKYIRDCIEKNERLNIDDYRLNPESSNATKHKGKTGSPGISGGRTAYTPEEDHAILCFVSKHVKETGGNKLWQEMAKKQVTSHSWQSMKYRYKIQLSHRLSEYKQADAKKKASLFLSIKNEKQNTEQNEPEEEKEESSSPMIPVETEDPEMDLTQISLSSDSQCEPAVVPQCNNNETCDLMETSKSEIGETPEQQQPAQPQPDLASSEKDDQLEATTEAKSPPISVNRPTTRQQFESPLKQTSRTKNFSSPKSDPRGLPKKVRRITEANMTEIVQEESEQRKTQTEEVNCPDSPQPTKKKAEKRKLGILEMATKEFEDDSESESDSQYETPGPSTSVEAVIATSSNPHPVTLMSENQQNPSPIQVEGEPPSTTTGTAITTITTATTSTAAVAPSISDAAVTEPTTRDNPPIEEVTSKAHLFIFESESQEVEEDSQSLVAGPSTSAAQNNGNKSSQTLSLTQDQLEEDVQLLKAFMKETNQDLVSVTKAILRASGDLILARELLMNPSSFSGPIWTRTEDQSLSSGDPTVRLELLTKYGEEGMAKRLMFLELER